MAVSWSFLRRRMFVLAVYPEGVLTICFALHELPASSCYFTLSALAVPDSSSCSSDRHLSSQQALPFQRMARGIWLVCFLRFSWPFYAVMLQIECRTFPQSLLSSFSWTFLLIIITHLKSSLPLFPARVSHSAPYLVLH